MRLGQLSRQTGLNTTEIVHYLSEQGISIKSGSNAKVEDEYVALVYEGFELELPHIEEVPEEATVEDEDTTNPEIETIALKEPETSDLDAKSEIEALYDHSSEVEEFTEDELATIQAKLAAQKLAAEEASKPENPDLIKAPKVSLPGLKVVGKIDLPEPKVKEEEITEEVAAVEPTKETEVVRRKRNPNQRRNAQRNKNKDINPVEQERRRKQNAARAKKRRQLEEEKERKRQYYVKQVQEKAVEQKTVTDQPDVEEPIKPEVKPKVLKRRNFLARFWRSLDAKDPSES